MKTRDLGLVWLALLVLSLFILPVIASNKTRDCEGEFLTDDDRRGQVELECADAGLQSAMLPTSDGDIDYIMVKVIKKITSLNFKNNIMESIPRFEFTFLSEVTKVNLGFNHLKAFPEQTLQNFINLYTLNLSSNLIVNGSEVLSTIPDTVITLDLSHNPIEKLSKTYGQVFNLEKLYLSNCKIHTIETDAFACLQNLNHLDLSHNAITSFGETYLSIVYLNLGSNQLTVPPEPMHRLKTMILSKNRISFIPEHVFSNMVDFTDLYIDGNDLQTISNTSLPLQRLTLLRVEDNPWDCCTLRWMTSDKIKALAREKHFHLR